MSKPSILIVGSTGQLGNEIRVLSGFYPSLYFIFSTKEDLNLLHANDIQNYLRKHSPDFCINCAAYTAVDKAETEKETAFAVNAEAVGALAKVCTELGTRLIHLSTDYVFDGTSQIPYREDDPVNPVNAYGATKLKGEQLCMEYDPQSIIIRTAWVYSAFGNNFVKTMLRLMKERTEINVVNDQVGAPTYAADLAKCILEIIKRESVIRQIQSLSIDSGLSTLIPGTYHYSNRGRISWYDFAVAIKELSGSACTINPIPSSQYPTPAKRPAFSLLDTHKIEKTFHCEIPDWKDSLKICLERLKT